LRAILDWVRISILPRTFYLKSLSTNVFIQDSIIPIVYQTKAHQTKVDALEKQRKAKSH